MSTGTSTDASQAPAEVEAAVLKAAGPTEADGPHDFVSAGAGVTVFAAVITSEH